MNEGRPWFTRGRVVLPAVAVAGFLLWRAKSKEPSGPLTNQTTTTVAQEPMVVASGVPASPYPVVEQKTVVREVPAASVDAPNEADARRLVDKGRLVLRRE